MIIQALHSVGESYIRTLAHYNIRETFIEESNLDFSVAYDATIRLMQKKIRILPQYSLATMK